MAVPTVLPTDVTWAGANLPAGLVNGLGDPEAGGEVSTHTRGTKQVD